MKPHLSPYISGHPNVRKRNEAGSSNLEADATEVSPANLSSKHSANVRVALRGASGDSMKEAAKDDKVDATHEADSRLSRVKIASQSQNTSKSSISQMPARMHLRAWFGSAVYLAGGLFLAFLYHGARSQSPKVLLPQLDTTVSPNPHGFTFGLLDCFADPKICMTGCCCPCLRWADTLDNQGLCSYWNAFFAMFGLMLLHIHTYGLSYFVVALLGGIYRQRLSQHFQIQSTSSWSHPIACLVWTFCQPCAIIQEAREASVVRSF